MLIKSQPGFVFHVTLPSAYPDDLKYIGTQAKNIHTEKVYVTMATNS